MCRAFLLGLRASILSTTPFQPQPSFRELPPFCGPPPLSPSSPRELSSQVSRAGHSASLLSSSESTFPLGFKAGKRQLSRQSKPLEMGFKAIGTKPGKDGNRGPGAHLTRLNKPALRGNFTGTNQIHSGCSGWVFEKHAAAQTNCQLTGRSYQESLFVFFLFLINQSSVERHPGGGL